MHAIAELVREAKRVSSEWVKEVQRVQKFAYKGLGPITTKDQGVVWPKK